MIRTFEKPKLIKELEAEINKGNLKKLKSFWEYVEINGAPIVEKIEDEENYDLVTIIYREDKKLKNVVLIPPVGMRKLENCIMEKLENTDLWYISYKVRNDISFTYQFSINDPLNNDWDRRWRNVKGDIYNKNYYKYIDKASKNERNVPYVQLEKAKKREYIKKNSNINGGTLHEHKIHSEYLKEERSFTVYTPFEYSKENKHYRVVFLNDGFEYINLLNAVNVLDNLIYTRKIPGIIAVFVDSDKDRAENLKCNESYAEFLVKEVFETVSNNYNISKNPKDNVIGGYSLGGLFASFLGLKYSNIFGNVLSQSGSYWYKREDYKNEEELWISNEFKKTSKLPLKFYINVGSIEPKVSMKDTNITFKNTLINLGYDVYFEEFGSGHDYLYWGETLGDGLIYLLNKR